MNNDPQTKRAPLDIRALLKQHEGPTSRSPSAKTISRESSSDGFLYPYLHRLPIPAMQNAVRMERTLRPYRSFSMWRQRYETLEGIERYWKIWLSYSLNAMKP